jgi:hypothetical protein
MRKYNQIGGKTHPEDEFPDNEKILKGFQWRESERPTSVEDLFKDDKPFVLPTIKGLDAYIPQEEFFDSNLLERVDKARPTPTKSLETPKKIKNKAARKLPKKFFNKPSKFKKLKKKN